MTVVRRSVVLRVDQLVPPAVLSKLLATGARQVRDAAVASGDAPPSFRTFVDGREGANEDNVRPDGAILYRFSALGVAAEFAIAFCIGRSPVREGRYRASWFIAVDGRVWTGAIRDIPPGATVMITNHAPYHRKIDTGGQVTVGRGIVEAARQAVLRRYPVLRVERQFVELPGGYVLKGHAARRLIARGKRARSGRRAGAVMTYPAVVISERR